MNRRALLFAMSIVLVFTWIGHSTAAEKPKASKAKKTKVAEKLPPPAPFVPGSWTLAILPDTQGYARRYPGLLRLQTRWIAENRDKQNIAYVLQNGDLTSRNIPMEWDRVDRGFKILEGRVPYAIVPGNHDYVKCGKGERITMINDYFPPSRFEKWPTFGGTMDKGCLESNYHLFKAGGKQWLILGLEWAPRDKTVEWADTILKKYPDHKAIILTHAYLYPDNSRHDWKKKGRKQKWNPHAYNPVGGANDGEDLWQKLIKKNANVFLVINGHVLGDGLGFQVSKGEHGNMVNEMAVNYQMQDFGGGAWMRLLEFLPDGRTVQAKTYSPLYERHETSPQNQFTFTVD